MNSPANWHLLSTRPAALNATLSNFVSKAGGTLIPLESMQIETRLTDVTVTRLLSALRLSVVVFTSPTAVDVAAEVLDLPGALNRRVVLATGTGTQKALVNRGVRQAAAPERMDTEGLLALPALAAVAGLDIGLVTGEGGRGLLQPTLEARGAQVLRADIYARLPREISAAEWARVQQASGRRILAVTSAEGFEHLMRQLPADIDTSDWGCVVASERLRALVAADADNTLRLPWRRDAVLARSAMPNDLIEAALTLV